MYQKNCDRCCRSSYSSCEVGEWLCPVCGHDLTAYPFFDAMTLERINMKLPPIHEKMDKYRKGYAYIRE
ncbi:ribosomal protein L37AE/L43A [Cytobacillus eiseniae]|uniref:Ribosomal protein L37AE/L43A n=1 Tax=Cytobacillus eiseniae TaxID=762947 RepID=A0ABS4RG38_9BACI|nr:ribosomal protein L37AE/L43A [Cytobacillus eiseniae]